MAFFQKQHAITCFLLGIVLTTACSASLMAAVPPPATRIPLVRVVDLELGESQTVELCDGTTARVKLLSVEETVDAIRSAVRAARVRVEVNGREIRLTSATYRLPVTVGKVQLDCPITKGYLANSNRNAWGLVKDARLRFWPAGSPLIAPGTFVYPLKQRWFASDTQMANEPTFVNGDERPSQRRIYYHDGLDFGGAEGMVDILSATDGMVVSAGTDSLPGYEDTPVRPRYDVVYIRDDRGWYYRYSHLQTIDPGIRLGQQVGIGQKIGVLGKEGGSGGWSHLHFDIQSRQPSGEWGTQAAYAFAWEAYQRQYRPSLVAVARPHHLTWVGQPVTLDGTRSWSRSGKIVRYEWTFTNGSKATGPKVERTYARPGTYSEILKVTDERGRVDYDFAVVQVIAESQPEQLPPTIHAAYSPTFNIRPGDAVTFKVRTFRTTEGNERWDFGDGSPPVTVTSDGNVNPHAKDGYAVTIHRYDKPGHYLVRVERSDQRGARAVAHLHVRVGGRD